MTCLDKLYFYHNIDDVVGVIGFKAFLKEGIANVDELFESYYEELTFPYFGFNWNALIDCLRDLEWIEENVICIIHRDVPKIEMDEMREYLDVLFIILLFWEKYAGVDKKIVKIYFPESARLLIENCIVNMDQNELWRPLQ